MDIFEQMAELDKAIEHINGVIKINDNRLIKNILYEAITSIEEVTNELWRKERQY